jgi:hypothetical protein
VNDKEKNYVKALLDIAWRMFEIIEKNLQEFNEYESYGDELVQIEKYFKENEEL